LARSHPRRKPTGCYDGITWSAAEATFKETGVPNESVVSLILTLHLTAQKGPLLHLNSKERHYFENFMANQSVRVAVTQAEPAWLDLQGAVAKTCDLIHEAAANGAQLIAFPEVWIPGYPGWIW
jgi:hypothetical protein